MIETLLSIIIVGLIFLIYQNLKKTEIKSNDENEENYSNIMF